MSKITINFNGTIDFEKIRDASAPYLLAICRRVLPNGKKEGDEYVALNPLRDDHKQGSFRINIKTGRWADFACPNEDNAKGGDIIGLIAYLYQVNQLEAARIIAQMIGKKL